MKHTQRIIAALTSVAILTAATTPLRAQDKEPTTRQKTPDAPAGPAGPAGPQAPGAPDALAVGPIVLPSEIVPTVGVVRVGSGLKVVRVDGVFTRVGENGTVIVPCGRHRIERHLMNVPCGSQTTYGFDPTAIPPPPPPLSTGERREMRSTPFFVAGLLGAVAGGAAFFSGMFAASTQSSACSRANSEIVAREDWKDCSYKLPVFAWAGFGTLIASLPFAIFGGMSVPRVE